MATLDARTGDAGYPPEIFLKIWAWNPQTTDWTLHSRIDQPHGTSHVFNVAFSPQSGTHPLYLASSGEGGSVKIWRLKEKARSCGYLTIILTYTENYSACFSRLVPTCFIEPDGVINPLRQLVF